MTCTIYTIRCGCFDQTWTTRGGYIKCNLIKLFLADQEFRRPVYLLSDCYWRVKKKNI